MPRNQVHLIAGARPNFMKVAPVWHAINHVADRLRPVLIHTGQHYDAEMSAVFLAQFGLPRPDHMLGAGSGSHAEQTAAVMLGYERVCLADRPDYVIVVGDVNSTAAAAITAKKLVLPVAHLEAGLRSFDRTMPEELNRVVTDCLADLLWTPSADADANLLAEGIPSSRIERVGNIMIDAFEMLRSKIESKGAAAARGLMPGAYAVVTLHRPANVDDHDHLAALVDALAAAAQHLPIVFPVHPRTRNRLDATNLGSRLGASKSIQLTHPLDYIEFMSLVTTARLVVTDSGGVQEETTYLGIPCITLRPNTERPVTLTQGSNRLATLDDVYQQIAAVLSGPPRIGQRPELWDGHTADRVVASLLRRMGC